MQTKSKKFLKIRCIYFDAKGESNPVSGLNTTADEIRITAIARALEHNVSFSFQIPSPPHPYNGDSSLLLNVKPSKDAVSDSPPQLPVRAVPETKPSSVLINNNTKMEMDNSATDEGHFDVETSKHF